MKNSQNSLTLLLNITPWYRQIKILQLWQQESKLQTSVIWRAEIIGKELYVILLADGRDLVYLVLMFLQSIFRQSSINE